MQSLYYKVCIQYFILRYNIVKPAITRVLTTPVLKRLLKVVATNTA